MSDSNHARKQAIAQCESIAGMVRAVEMDWTRLDQLRLLRSQAKDAGEASEVEEFDAEYGEELDELEEARGEYESLEDVEQAIDNDPLSVQVRSGWYTPGEGSPDPEEFEILLCTGGPAVRIRGELGMHLEPYRAWIEYQDWGTPWTELVDRPIETSTLLAYCQRFYYGG